MRWEGGRGARASWVETCVDDNSPENCKIRTRPVPNQREYGDATAWALGEWAYLGVTEQLVGD